MTTKEITVRERVYPFGSIKARLMMCSCGCTSFMCYVVNGHLHFQCTGCTETFCPGGCADGKELEAQT